MQLVVDALHRLGANAFVISFIHYDRLHRAIVSGEQRHELLVESQARRSQRWPKFAKLVDRLADHPQRQVVEVVALDGAFVGDEGLIRACKPLLEIPIGLERIVGRGHRQQRPAKVILHARPPALRPDFVEGINHVAHALVGEQHRGSGQRSPMRLVALRHAVDQVQAEGPIPVGQRPVNRVRFAARRHKRGDLLRQRTMRINDDHRRVWVIGDHVRRQDGHQVALARLRLGHQANVAVQHVWR